MDEVKILIELVRTRSLSGEEKEIAGSNKRKDGGCRR
jgi:hypothetical protein